MIAALGIPCSAIADNYETQQRLMEDAQESQAIGRKKGNFVLAPVPVADPTIGTGLIGVLMYLHPQQAGEQESPNDTSGLAVMYTDTESWMTGLFHNTSWDDDRFRFTGIIGYGELNLEYYGVGENSPLSDHPIDYSIKGTLITPELLMRIAGTENWFAGLHFRYLDSNITFDSSSLVSQLPDITEEVTTTGLGPVLSYDSRNDNYYPTQGNYLYLNYIVFGEYLGGKYEYQLLESLFNHYLPLSSSTVYALQLAYKDSSGDVPFFNLPSLDIRGLSRSRYIDGTTFTLRNELRYRFHPRWSTVVFVDAGWYGEDRSELRASETISSAGTGLRWQTTAEQALNLGLDIAYSQGDYQVFIQIGEKF